MLSARRLIFPQITAVAERSYREASLGNIFETSSWDAVESDEFKEDFAKLILEFRA